MSEYELPLLPYCGLNSFSLRDKNIFAGRENEVETAFKLVLQYRGMILYGSSGIGKSSLISAGLLPKLFENNMFSAETIRINPDPNGTFVINRIKTTDESMYMPSIFDSLNKDDGNRINVSFIAFEQILSSFHIKVRTDQPIDHPIPVLIFDQFEELITLFEECGEDAKKLAMQEQIVRLLARSFYDESLKVKFIFVFREDYLAKFDHLFYAIPDLKLFCAHVKPLEKSLLYKVIGCPFDSTEKQRHFKNPFNDQVIQEIGDQFMARFQKSPLNLSEVQMVCSRLYSSMTSNAERLKYLVNAGVDRALENIYLDLLNNIPKDTHELAIEILSQLVLNERTRNIVHEDAIKENLKFRHTAKKIEGALELLEESTRIIRKESRQGGTYYEIISEAIIPYINQENKKKEHLKEIADIRRLFWRNLAIIAVGIVALVLIYTGFRFVRMRDALRKISVAEGKITSLGKNPHASQADTTRRKGIFSSSPDAEPTDKKGIQNAAYSLYDEALDQAAENLKVVIFPKMVNILFDQENYGKSVELYRNTVGDEDENIVLFYAMIDKINQATADLQSDCKPMDSVRRNTLLTRLDSTRRKALIIAFNNKTEDDPNFMNYLASNLADVHMDSLCFATLEKARMPNDWAVEKLGFYYENGVANQLPDLHKAEMLYKEHEYVPSLIGVYFRMDKDKVANSYLDSMRAMDIFFLGLDFYDRALGTSDTNRVMNYKVAGKILERVSDSIAINTDEFFYHYLGNCYARQDRYADALRIFNQGLYINPENEYLLNSIAWWTTKFDPSKQGLLQALEYSKKSIRFAEYIEDRANHLDTKAEILLLLGEYAESLKACEQSKVYIDRCPPSQITAELRNGVADRIKKIQDLLAKN